MRTAWSLVCLLQSLKCKLQVVKLRQVTTFVGVSFQKVFLVRYSDLIESCGWRYTKDTTRSDDSHASLAN